MNVSTTENSSGLLHVTFRSKQNNANQNNLKMVFGVALIKNKSSVAVGLGMIIKAHIQNQADGNG